MHRLHALALIFLAIIAVPGQAAAAGDPFVRVEPISSFPQFDFERATTPHGRAVAFGQFLRHIVPTAVYLDLRRSQGSKISDDEAVQISAALVGNKHLKRLDLSGNHIADRGAMAIAQALWGNTTLEHLDLSLQHSPQISHYGEAPRPLTSDAGLAFSTALARNTTLKHLDLSGNGISPVAIVAIVEALGRNSTLTHLNMGYQSHGSVGLEEVVYGSITAAQAIAAALAENTNLLALSLESTEIGDHGASALAELVSANRTLEYLNLGRNGIGAAGFAAMAGALKGNSTLQELSLSDQRLGSVGRPYPGDDGAIALATALQENSGLITLRIAGNGIGDAGVAAIGAALPYNMTLTTLDLAGNPFGDVGASALVAGLTDNPFLTTLRRYLGPGHKANEQLISDLLARNAQFQQYLPRALALMMSTGWPKPRVPGGTRSMPVEVWKMTLLEFLVPLSASQSSH